MDNNDVRELKAHSRAKTPVVKKSKTMKRTTGALRQKALDAGLAVRHNANARLSRSALATLTPRRATVRLSTRKSYLLRSRDRASLHRAVGFQCMNRNQPTRPTATISTTIEPSSFGGTRLGTAGTDTGEVATGLAT